MASIAKRPDGRYRARYRDDDGQEHAKHFRLRKEAQAWLDGQAATLVAGTHVSPRDTRITVEQWCTTWLAGHHARPSSVKQARVHIKHIVARFGPRQLGSIRPSEVRGWVVDMRKELADSTVHRTHSRLSQIMGDAVHDGYLARNPCSRRTAPSMGKQRPFVCTTEQMWALHDTMPEHLRIAVLLASFAGLRLGEVCGLRVQDIDFLRGVILPAVQPDGAPLKEESSCAPVPVPRALVEAIATHLTTRPVPGEHILWRNAGGRPAGRWTIDTAVRRARAAEQSTVQLPDGFHFHDLRHYYASMLIASGVNIKTVQARMRHATASTTLDIYGHLWPDEDEGTRKVVGEAMVRPADRLRTTR